jgi:hypothetical protein
MRSRISDSSIEMVLNDPVVTMGGGGGGELELYFAELEGRHVTNFIYRPCCMLDRNFR